MSAAQALGLLGEVAAKNERAIFSLLRSLRQDEWSPVRGWAARALAGMDETAVRDERIIPALIRSLSGDEDASVREWVAQALGEIRGGAAASHPDVIPALIRSLLQDEDYRARMGAATALGEMGETATRDERVIPALLKAMEDDELELDYVRGNAAAALVRLEESAAHDAGSTPAILRSFEKTNSMWLRWRTVEAWGTRPGVALSDERVIGTLLRSSREGDLNLRSGAAIALAATFGLGLRVFEDHLTLEITAIEKLATL